MKYEKIVTLFDTPEHADAARHNLEAAGYAANEISIMNSKTLSSGGTAVREPGLWHRLFGRDIERNEALVYGRTVESGGVVLTLRAPESEVPRAMGILNVHKVVDVQERAAEHGLISGAPQAPAPGATATGGMGMGAAGTRAAESVATPIGRDQVLRLAEEQLDVGKRLVQEGTTRIRRFVTEKPVEAKVTLHEEHAQVVRRAVSDPNYVKDIDWSDKTIEVTETAEEPIVRKTAHIAEEVVVSKEGTDREETVHDTVRRQQIEVERGRGSERPPLRKAG
ncbi:MAG: YsnF/AvaK domain-containing protein [Bryobacterales bacterium]|nr:YsnF/AvaK domain-containing protein [Bryobacterales bacterium]MBV9398970.1 YsnF/AvaK domain-containing protein [Bryobacterales bacterium]